MRGAVIEKVATTTSRVSNKQKGIALIEKEIIYMLKELIRTIQKIIKAFKNHDLDSLLENNKLESILTLRYYDLLEQVNYCLTAYNVLAKLYRRCIGSIYLSSDILNLIRRINLIVILGEKAICDVGNLPSVIILLKSVVDKLRSFAKVYDTRNHDQITTNILAQTTFGKKWHCERKKLLELLKKQDTVKKTSQITNILTMVHEIRSMAFIIVMMYERLLYIERGKIYHLTNDNF